MLDTLTSTRSMMALLAALVLGIGWVLHRRSASPQSKIHLDDLLLGDDAKMSKAATVMLGSFALTTWVIVYLTMTEKLNEGYFTAYLAAWVAPTVTKLIKGIAPNVPSATP